MSRTTTLFDSSVWLSFAAPRWAGRADKTGEGSYPPYNVELLARNEGEPDVLRITLAVAGFSPDELEVSVEDGELTIRGKQHDERPRDYLHRGIAARQFKRGFQLATGTEVRKAELHDGLLAIELVRPSRRKRVVKVGIDAAD
jgi:HSP20 family molecular chaperone IbpA